MKVFENANVGDVVWDLSMGYGKINDIDKDSVLPIRVYFEDCNAYETYTFDGKRRRRDLYPTLFCKKREFKFDLEECLRELEIVKFSPNQTNYSLTWDYKLNKICRVFTFIRYLNTLYFSKKSVNAFIEKVKGEEISEREFLDTYKKVFADEIYK